MANTAEPRERVKKQSTLKGIFIGLTIGLLVAAIAYFVGGWTQGAAYKGQITSLRQETTAAGSGVERAEGVNNLLRARGEMYEAAMDLERRNYGSASEDLRQADQLLAKVDPAQAGVNGAQIEDIRKTLKGTDLTVQSDVGEQRTRVLGLADQLGNLIPEPSAP